MVCILEKPLVRAWGSTAAANVRFAQGGSRFRQELEDVFQIGTETFLTGCRSQHWTKIQDAEILSKKKPALGRAIRTA
jgi:hypothetical protein